DARATGKTRQAGESRSTGEARGTGEARHRAPARPRARALPAAQARPVQQAHHLAAADLERARQHDLPVTVFGDVVVVAFEGAAGDAEAGGEQVELVVG